ncbi:MAG: hypothetical protein JO336_09955, partial [Acidobacteriia bacterium]|nr:hypothetical protein [Terriglobia bacterium]
MRSATGSGLPVTVIVDYEQPRYSNVSLQAMRDELQSLLNPVGLKIDLLTRNAVAPDRQFGELMVFKMKGHCTMDEWPVDALSDERGPLAMAYSSDGEVLSFGVVECDRVRECLQRVLGKGNPNQYQSALGTALGVVLAHEMYHMMSNSAKHTKEGVTKESFSGRDLLAGHL